MVLTRRAAVSAAAAIASAAVLAGCSESPAGEGPLQKPNRHAWQMSVEPGEAFTDGVESLELPGRRGAVLRGVAIVGDKEIKLVGVKLVKPGRKWGLIQSAGWPVDDPDIRPSEVVPADGATFTPRDVDPQGWELLIGMRVDEPGRFVCRGVVVDYTYRGQDYRQYFPAALSVCTDGTPRKECPPPKGWEHFPESLPSS